MTRRFDAIAAALSLTLASLGQTQSTELTAETSFKAPAAISVAYRDPRIATTPAEAHRQGGFSVAGAGQWRSASEPMIVTEAFKAPGVISVAYRNPRSPVRLVLLAVRAGLKATRALTSPRPTGRGLLWGNAPMCNCVASRSNTPSSLS